MTASGPRPTAPGSGSEFNPSNEQPVIAATRHAPPMANDLTFLVPVTAVAPLLRAATAYRVPQPVAPDPRERQGIAEAACRPQWKGVPGAQWAAPESARPDTTPATGWRVLPHPANTTPVVPVAVPSREAVGHRLRRGRPKPMGKARAGRLALRLLVPTSGRCR